MHVRIAEFGSAPPGKRVIVLEGRVRGAGQSGKDTGELLAWNNHQFHTLQQAYGDKLTAQVAQSHHAAIAAVHDLVKTESISCQYTPVTGYIQASERLLAAESKAFNAAGTQAEKVRTLTRSHGLLKPLCNSGIQARFQLYSTKFARSCLRCTAWHNRLLGTRLSPEVRASLAAQVHMSDELQVVFIYWAGGPTPFPNINIHILGLCVFSGVLGHWGQCGWFPGVSAVLWQCSAEPNGLHQWPG